MERQARLPDVRDPKLWMVRCRAGKERELAVCLMQKFKLGVRCPARHPSRGLWGEWGWLALGMAGRE